MFSLEAVAAIATIVGTVVSILALVEARSWLLVASILIVCLSIAAILYARRERLALLAAATVIEGYSIDSLNVANLRRSVNKSFVVQKAIHTARVKGDDLELTWRYAGFCGKTAQAAFEFSIHADANTPFDLLNCVAFDVGKDPEMTYGIRPVLIGAEGISKRVSVPFLDPVKPQQSFDVLLQCTIPGCMTPGFGYYTSTLAFGQDRVEVCEIQLRFEGLLPAWVRVYERTPSKAPELVKSLRPSQEEPGKVEYVDAPGSRPGQSTRVYVFWRDGAQSNHENPS